MQFGIQNSEFGMRDWRSPARTLRIHPEFGMRELAQHQLAYAEFMNEFQIPNSEFSKFSRCFHAVVSGSLRQTSRLRDGSDSLAHGDRGVLVHPPRRRSISEDR